MNRDMHTVEVVDGSVTAHNDRIMFGTQQNVANAIGSGAGLGVTSTVTFSKGLPANFSVLVTPSQDCTYYVNNYTATGFDVILMPRLAANTLAAGTFDVIVLG